MQSAAGCAAPLPPEQPAASLEQHLARAPLCRTQWLVWGLAAAGKFLEGLIVFLGGLVLPLLDGSFALSPLQRGAVAAAGLLGILVGSLAFGGLADRWGRRPVFIAEMALLLVGLLLAAISPGPWWLIAALLVIGLALGADYPTAHLVIAECLPAAVRGRLVLAAFSFQALGVVSGTALVALVLQLAPRLEAWRLIYLGPALPVFLLTLLRWRLPESSHWLLSRGQVGAAELSLARLLERPGLRLLALPEAAASAPVPGGEVLRQLLGPRWRRATTLAAVPWFLQDLATYGIGIFLPLLIGGALGAAPGGAPSGGQGGDLIAVDRLAARASLLIDPALLAGFAVAIAGTDRWGRMPLQIGGFLGCAAGLLLAAAGAGRGAGPAALPLLMAGLVLFQFMTNLGPNAQTYLLAGELFPTAMRGRAAGLAAATGKVAAVLSAFLLPPGLQRWGAAPLLVSLALSSLLGAAVTWRCRIETNGAVLQDS